MNKGGIIYCATNKINGKKYIGQTMCTLSHRRKQHEVKQKRKTRFKRALDKYGVGNFQWDVIDTASTEEELNEKECYYIKYYGTYGPDGYNSTTGGQKTKRNAYSKPNVTFDIDGNYLKRYNTQTDFAEEIGSIVSVTQKAVCGLRPTVKDIIVMFESEYTPEYLRQKIKRAEWQKKKFCIYLASDGSLVYEGRSLPDAEKAISVQRRTLYSYLYGEIKNGKYRAEYVTSDD